MTMIARDQHGFSLIEMVIAITLLAILAGASAIFLRGPIAGYFDMERRSDLAESGQLAMLKIGREMGRAVPNSVRVSLPPGGGFFIEALPVRAEGRYRSAIPGNALNGGTNSFDVPGFNVSAMAGDWVVVNSHLGSVWTGTNPGVRALYTGAGGTVATVLHSGHTYLTDSAPNPAHRFQIATTPVTYFCNPANGELRRYSGYALQAAQPTNAAAAPLAGAQNDLVAERIATCSAMVTPGTRSQAQVLSLLLTLRDSGDVLNLYHAVKVEALP